MFKTILAAVDGSDDAYEAVRLAAGLATRCESRLILLHVIEGGRLSPPLRELARVEHLADEGEVERAGFLNFGNQAARVAADVSNDRAMLEHERHIRYALARMILQNASGAAEQGGKPGPVTATVEGEPARAIADHAEREGADLVVVASRGLGDAEALLAGSVSHRVLQLCRCPCLVVR